MRNRWYDALLKTVVFLAVAHVVFLITGFFVKTDVGIFNLPMWWAHWSDNMLDAGIGIVLSIVTYFIVYFFFTHEESTQIEHNS